MSEITVARYEAFEKGVAFEQERIIKLLEADMEHAFGEDGKCFYENHYREVCNCDLIALIKGENKGHNGAEHTPCCNDWGCYGCEDCDCPDCLQGEK